MSHLSVDYKVQLTGLPSKEAYQLMLKDKYFDLSIDENYHAEYRTLKRVKSSLSFLNEILLTKKTFNCLEDDEKITNLEGVISEVSVMVNYTLYALNNMIANFSTEAELSGRFSQELTLELKKVLEEAKLSLINTLESQLSAEEMRGFNELWPSFDVYYETMKKLINWKISRLMGAENPSTASIEEEHGKCAQVNLLSKNAPDHLKAILATIEESAMERVFELSEKPQSLNLKKLNKTTSFKVLIENDKITAFDFLLVMQVFMQHISSNLLEESKKEALLASLLSFINKEVFKALNLKLEFLITKFGYLGHSDKDEELFLDHYQQQLKMKVEKKLSDLKWNNKKIKVERKVM